MIAQYRSVCPACDEFIHPGNDIRVIHEYDHNAGTGYATGTKFAHAVCPEASEQTADVAALKAPRCPRCTLNHPGECY